MFQGYVMYFIHCQSDCLKTQEKYINEKSVIIGCVLLFHFVRNTLQNS